MQPVDLAILALIVLTTIGGLAQGFFRTAFGLAGLFFGLLLGAWNYARMARVLQPIVRIELLADAVGFIVIALLVMMLASYAGKVLHKAAHHMGLGCLDRLGGGVVGALQGVMGVMLVVWVTVAFFPNAEWLVRARLPREFFGACHLSTRVSPGELSDRVHSGLRTIELQAPTWLHGDSPADEPAKEPTRKPANKPLK